MSLVTPKVTHFHTLGLVPGSDKIDAARAYKAKVEELLTEEFSLRGSMATSYILDEIAKLTEATKVLTHGDYRDRYMKFLLKNMLLCPLCEGKGKITLNHGLTELPCEACKRTGWGTEMLQDYDKPRESICPIEVPQK